MTYRDTTGNKPEPGEHTTGPARRAPRSLARNRLTAAFVRSVVHQGRCKRAERHHDGGGLYLQVMPTGSKQWVQRLAFNGTQYYYGLGPLSELSLAEARELSDENAVAARRYRRAAARGEKPRLPAFEAQRRATMAKRRGQPRPIEAAAAAGLTFAAAFERCIEERARDWKNPGTDLRSWRADLRTHLKDIAPLPVGAVTVEHLREVMDRVASRATRDKILRRCGTVFAFAEAGELLHHGNPARKLRATWSGLKRPGAVHRKALPYAEVPALFARLVAGGTGGDARGALALVVLTAVRSGEARGARWEEFDLREEAPAWTIPGERMKDGREHRVALCEAAFAVVRRAGPRRAGLVFRSPRGREVSGKALRRVLADLGVDATVHGFRSSLRDWCAEHGVARECAESCLAHRTGSSVEQAYARSDLYERRKAEVTDPYGAFVAGSAR